MSVRVEATTRLANVDAFRPWSATVTRYASSACTWAASAGSPDMRRMSAACPRPASGGIGAWPCRSRIRPAVKTPARPPDAARRPGHCRPGSWRPARASRRWVPARARPRRPNPGAGTPRPGGAQRRLPVLRGRGLIQELLEQHRHHAFIGLACCQIIERAPADDQFSTIAIHLGQDGFRRDHFVQTYRHHMLLVDGIMFICNSIDVNLD